MVVPLFGWSAGDIVTPIKILSTIAGAFKEATGAKSQFAEASTWLESFASDLERMNEYTTENPDAKYTKNIIEQVASIHSHYAEFEMYLQKFDNGLSSTRDASVITVVVKKIKWTFKELKGKVDSLKFAVTGPILSINMLLMLQCRADIADVAERVTNLPPSRRISDIETMLQSFHRRIDLLDGTQSRFEAAIADERTMVKDELEHCVSESSAKIIKSHLDATARVLNLIEESDSNFKNQLLTIRDLLESMEASSESSESFHDSLEQQLRTLDGIKDLVEKNERLEQAFIALHGEISASSSERRQVTIFEIVHATRTAGENAEERDKRGKENQESSHTTLDNEHSASSEDDSDSEEQWPLPSWPVQLCHKCIPMTSTVEGLRALSTPSGYIHHEFEDLFKSADKGCVLCHEIRNHITGCDDIQYFQSSYTQWINNLKKELYTVSIRGSFTSIPLSDEKYLGSPVLELKNLEVGRIPRNRVRHTYPLSKLPFESRTREKFDVFTDAQAPNYLHPNIVAKNVFSVAQRHLFVSVASPPVVQAAQHLLKDCISSHTSTCPSNLNPILPLRVIDVQAEDNQERLALRITSSTERGPYTALSYCWGQPPYHFITTAETLKNPSCIDWTQAPATIRDAISVTRSLGIRYLWVDAICIAQDDDLDKANEIKEMAEVYKNATVTIAAASSPDVKCGFLEDRLFPKIPLPLALPEGGLGTLWTHEGFLTSPDEHLDRRGWTLQEALLSPRILYYGCKELIWKCQHEPFKPVFPTHQFYYTGPNAAHRLPSTVFDVPSKQTPFARVFWVWIQNTYSRRHLQFFDDRYLAIGAVAKELHRVTGDTYIAGLWKRCILQDLAWFSNSEGYARKPYPRQSPSWSWLSQFQPVNTFGIWEEDPKRPKLISYSVQLADPTALFGHVLGGELVLQATVINATKVSENFVTESIHDSDLYLDVAENLLHYHYEGEEYWYLYLARSEQPRLPDSPPYKSGVHVTLLLRSLGDGTFVREGLLLVRSEKYPNFWDMKEEMTVRLV